MKLFQSFANDVNGTTKVEFALIAMVIACALISVLTSASSAPEANNQAGVHHPG